jgi:hypothetical protein
MGDAASWAGVIIAMGSLIVAIIAMRKSFHAEQEAIAAQRRIVEIEEWREKERRLDALQAKLQAELREMGNGSERLYLVNLGRAEARNVKVSFDGKPLEEHCASVGGDSLPSLVGPGAEVSCLVSITNVCAPPFQCEVRWDDDSGLDRLYRTTLTW